MALACSVPALLLVLCRCRMAHQLRTRCFDGSPPYLLSQTLILRRKPGLLAFSVLHAAFTLAAMTALQVWAFGVASDRAVVEAFLPAPLLSSLFFAAFGKQHPWYPCIARI